MKTPFAIGRRQFLLGLQGSALAVPFLPSLARGATPAGAYKKNFISYRITNGCFGHMWYPSDAATAALKLVEPNVREMPLAGISGPISTILDASFDAFRSKMILMRHIDRLDHSDHGPGNGLYGWAIYKDEDPNVYKGLPPSIDKLMAARAPGGMVQPLNLSVRWSETGASCSFATTAQGVPVGEAGFYPDQAFQKLFAGFSVDEGTAARRQAYKKGIVDRVLPHFQSVRANPRLSAVDRTILDQHIDHIHSLQQQLSRGVVTCKAPGTPARWGSKPEEVNGAAQAQVDIAVAALRCGLTPIVNFDLDPDTLMTKDLHGVEGGHHGASHEDKPSAVLSIENAHHWHMRYLADFLAKLDATVDPTDGKTLLDNSLVFVNNEIGNQNGPAGNQATSLDLNHIGVDIQTMIVGSCGGALRTGNFIDYRTDFKRNRWSQYIGTAYNGLLVSCMLAMGLGPADWEVGGKPGYGDMRGAQYNMTPLDKVVIGDMRSYLPRLKA